MPLPDLAGLDQYAATPFPGDWPSTMRVLYSPVDRVHDALLALIGSAAESLVLVMYGFDDLALADVIKTKLADPAISVQLTLDSSQAAGVHERAILAAEQYPASSVAIGRSERGAIIHMKAGVVDGRFAFDGSTNWSASGEKLQDNSLGVFDDRAIAARYRARIDAIHAHVLAAAFPHAA